LLLISIVYLSSIAAKLATSIAIHQITHKSVDKQYLLPTSVPWCTRTKLVQGAQAFLHCSRHMWRRSRPKDQESGCIAQQDSRIKVRDPFGYRCPPRSSGRTILCVYNNNLNGVRNVISVDRPSPRAQPWIGWCADQALIIRGGRLSGSGTGRPRSSRHPCYVELSSARDKKPLYRDQRP